MEEHFNFMSSDHKQHIHAIKWTQPNVEPVAALQIIHGMSEYIQRYAPFANWLSEKGYVVYGHDHLGHGESCHNEQQKLGYFTENDSANVLITDARKLTEHIHTEHPKLPIFILGHSMGSFILRNYLQLYHEDIKGAIIMGTGSYLKAVKLGISIAEKGIQRHPYKVNKLLDLLVIGGYAAKVTRPTSQLDWLSKNPENVQRALADEQIGFSFTNNGFHTLFTLHEGATKEGWWQRIPPQLPLLITSGELDPVGDMGKGPRKVAKELADAGFTNVTLQLYTHMRHEILNEVAALMVFRDIYHWLENIPSV